MQREGPDLHLGSWRGENTSHKKAGTCRLEGAGVAVANLSRYFMARKKILV